ncbi:hypothetical protein CISG_03492 [Coccidioides immitis RMSCC 3703]|uniref:Uncharacterized protein n=2 Tax=Coccidioides immitis TaxID=5501 RepID=A0A0J8QPI6_COCIT|nr:hypothetical protein CIRG_03333 [Coccidioides immitis RMSCC 2394]KMU73233.1 hypothetical protein CISG_03492 [Coccidioides immitis RMSCC 3703]
MALQSSRGVELYHVKHNWTLTRTWKAICQVYDLKAENFRALSAGSHGFRSSRANSGQQGGMMYEVLPFSRSKIFDQGIPHLGGRKLQRPPHRRFAVEKRVQISGWTAMPHPYAGWEKDKGYSRGEGRLALGLTLVIGQLGLTGSSSSRDN